MKKIIFFVNFIFILFFSLKLEAGNPAFMNPQTETPLIWDTSEPIPYEVDVGGLGRLTYDQSLALVQFALSVFEDLEGANLSFQYNGPTDEDITLDNYETYADTSLQQNESNRELTFVFDETGEIIDDIGNEALGVTVITGVLGTRDEPDFITRAVIYIDATYLDDDLTNHSNSINSTAAVLVHEVAHALDLEHTLDSYYYGIAGWRQFSSTMYPGSQGGGCSKYSLQLSPDDIATLKWMYGASDVHTISGNVYNASGELQESLVVIARNVDSPYCQHYEQVTSVVCSMRNGVENGTGFSGFPYKYCQNPDQMGAFTIPVLENGNYIVDVQEFNTSSATINMFTGNNSPIDIPGEAEFYNDNDAVDEDPYTYSLIGVNGEDISGIDIYLSSDEASDDALKRIPYTYFRDDDFFTNLEDEVYCSATYDVDVAELIGVEELVVESCPLESVEPTNNGDDGDDNSSSGNGSQTTSASGCQLHVNNQMPSIGLLETSLGLVFLNYLRLRRKKFKYD